MNGLGQFQMTIGIRSMTANFNQRSFSDRSAARTDWAHFQLDIQSCMLFL